MHASSLVFKAVIQHRLTAAVEQAAYNCMLLILSLKLLSGRGLCLSRAPLLQLNAAHLVLEAVCLAWAQHQVDLRQLHAFHLVFEGVLQHRPVPNTEQTGSTACFMLHHVLRAGFQHSPMQDIGQARQQLCP